MCRHERDNSEVGAARTDHVLQQRGLIQAAEVRNIKADDEAEALQKEASAMSGTDPDRGMRTTT
jgi:hypothetical protein